MDSVNNTEGEVTKISISELINNYLLDCKNNNLVEASKHALSSKNDKERDVILLGIYLFEDSAQRKGLMRAFNIELYEDIPVLKELLQRMSFIKKIDSRIFIPIFESAILKNDFDIIKILLNRGVTFRGFNENELVMAIKNDNISLFFNLIKWGKGWQCDYTIKIGLSLLFAYVTKKYKYLNHLLEYLGMNIDLYDPKEDSYYLDKDSNNKIIEYFKEIYNISKFNLMWLTECGKEDFLNNAEFRELVSDVSHHIKYRGIDSDGYRKHK
jgi:hypothetical protein